ncbi:hypothetical protein QFZ41_003177 [Luteibacter sp. W1I16]|jgi:hypothetical protein|uniref:hypothetical protein n=1 Tax=Luteibacter sp. W1I16 TaxID=3373922 RepID=UPI003D199A40
MSIKTPLKTLHHNFLKVTAAAALTLACGTHTEPARAGVPVIDYTAIVNALQNYWEQYGRWIDTAQHYQQVLDHYTKQAAFWETQLNKLQHLNFTLFKLKHQFTEVAEDFGVEVECPGRVASGGLAGVLDSALDKLLPDMNGDVIEQQQKICALIVQAKNIKYNDTVRYLNYVAEKGTEMENVQTSLIGKIGESEGNTTAFAAQLTEFGQTLSTARAQWESNQKQADAQIDMLLTMQANLSRRAMNGSPSVLGTVVDAAALKAAFN